MNYFKGLIIILFVALIGMFVGSYIYNESKYDTKDVFNENNKIYLLQYGVYTTEDNMKENTKKLENYFYYKEDDGYHVIIGIVENKNIYKKIGESYGVKENIYLKEVNINNMEFLESLRQYDTLVSSLKDSKAIINAEKQILSKYEELILNNG